MLKEGLWIVLTMVALSDRRGRLMTFLLLFLWLYSYAFVFFSWFDPAGYEASLWITLIVLGLAMAVLRFEGTSPWSVAVVGLLALSFAVQAVFWAVPTFSSRFSIPLYYFGTTVFTVQLGLMATGAIMTRLDTQRRRKRQREVLSR